MAAICHMCTAKITKERFPGVKCGGSCENLFHITCARISKPLLEGIKNRSASWLCEDCRVCANQSIVDIDDEISEPTNNINLTDIMKQLKRMEKQLSTVEELKANVEAIKLANIALESKVKSLEVQIAHHNMKIHHIEAINDKPNQLSNEKNIVIRGLPMKHGDIGGLIINTISKVGVAIQASDIVSIESIHKRIPITPVDKNKTHNSQDYFIVTLTSVDLKNNILTQMRKTKTLNTNDLDIILPANHPEQRIFMMQHLTAFQSQLYREAKNIKLKYKYKYLWCKGGQIYLRKTPESNVHRINSFNVIFRLEQQENPSGDYVYDD